MIQAEPVLLGVTVLACPRIMSTDLDGLTCKIPMSRCSSLITSAALLDNMMPFQLELAENIAAVLLTLSKNVLELSKNSLKTSPRAHST